jgi:hypothetical protein
LEVLYGGLGIGKLNFFYQKSVLKILAVFFFNFLIIETLDPEVGTGSVSGSIFIESDATTLLANQVNMKS